MTTKSLTEKNDTYTGSNNDDVIYGLGGDDSIFGSNGDDEIHGGNGDDTLRAGKGNDKLFGEAGDYLMTLYTGHEVFDGGSGIDFIDFYYATKGVAIDLNEGSTRYNIGANVGRVDYKNIEAVYGSAHNDKVTGDGKANILRGEDGDDQVSAGKGDDLISGGDGQDVLTGGAGKDSFIFGSAPDGAKNFDRVKDFDDGDDRVGFNVSTFKIDLVGKVSHFRDYNFKTIDADQFQAGAGHEAKNADIRVIYDSSDGILYFDKNGSKDGGPDEIVDLGKHLDLTADSIFGYGF